MKPFSLLAVLPALFLAACGNTSAPKSATAIQLSAGTFNAEGEDVLGTALLLRVQLPDGTAPKQDVPVTITGPSGWNGDQPLTVMYPANESIFPSLDFRVAAVGGIYNASVQVAGQTSSDTSSSVDVNSKLSVPGMVTVSEAANQSVAVAWNKVDGAATYQMQVYNLEKRNDLFEATSYVKTPTTVFSESLLNFKTRYTIDILASNVDLGVDDQSTITFPSQFNVSAGFLGQAIERSP
ncbi:hypothetical protein [Deinococcus sp.]|uniref:hypothetical protein n=1 Tax=Deinococcus sp. TaxID=47478 RepID=UPI003B5B9688